MHKSKNALSRLVYGLKRTIKKQAFKQGNGMKDHTEKKTGAKTKGSALPVGTKVVLDEDGIAQLIGVLIKTGYQPIGPTVRDGAVVYEPITSPKDFPIGLSDEQEGGRYRLVEGTPGAYFEYLCGPTSWKKYLFPPRQKLWSAEKKGQGYQIEKSDEKIPTYAFIGVRPCELAAIKIQDKVFGYDKKELMHHEVYADTGYVARREKALIVGVNCARAGKTCFCSSMGGGPQHEEGSGYDLVLTELLEGQKHDFIVAAGTEKGKAILEHLPVRPASDMEVREAETISSRARRQMGRVMTPDIHNILKRNLEHPRWETIAERCLTCGNCTMACPTCFCNTVEDTTDLTGNHAERWRLWDSCFSIDFSYIHGGPMRREAKSRYRQWMTHKLSHWHEQFGVSGCVGCGRCITWCPVGIDITEEAKAIKYSSR